jgi:hypothetical protein
MEAAAETGEAMADLTAATLPERQVDAAPAWAYRPPPHDRGTAGYERHRPETTALYELVRDNLDTLYRAIAEVRSTSGYRSTRRSGPGQVTASHISSRLADCRATR